MKKCSTNKNRTNFQFVKNNVNFHTIFPLFIYSHIHFLDKDFFFNRFLTGVLGLYSENIN